MKEFISGNGSWSYRSAIIINGVFFLILNQLVRLITMVEEMW